MTLRLIAFTRRGFSLAQRLAEGLGGQAMRCGEPLPLARWTQRAFEEADGLIFVGAAGIAVRAIAPHVRSKAGDPAVVVVDEGGRYAIPILSGHLGGANDLAVKAARLCGGVPVLTTATDVNGVFAVDQWARRQGCLVLEPERIKGVSSRLLDGQTVRFYSAFPISGRCPEGLMPAGEGPWDVTVSVDPPGDGALHLVPPIAVLGVGCKRGTPWEAVQAMFERLTGESGLREEAVTLACTIDRKREEPGLLEFCARRGLALRTFSAEELGRAEGEFSASAFVESVTGVDNVCERSAVLGSGGRLWKKKMAGDGVTMAVALKPFAPDWEWRNE